jgi:pimeloyl-ACP methyl ester carboxylesterase
MLSRTIIRGNCRFLVRLLLLVRPRLTWRGKRRPRTMSKQLLLPTAHMFASILTIVHPVFAQPKALPGPAPGKFIEIGGHKLHFRCTGPVDARPTVVFEAGGGGFSKDWTSVQEILAARFRTCAYDRAGLGWSEPGPAPRTLRQEVFELHTARDLAGISTPMILVGQSIGALNVRLYTEQYGSEVGGIVLVDPTDESSTLFSLRENRWIRLRDMAAGRTVPAPRSTGPPSSGYRPEEDYLGEEAQLFYLRRKENPEPFGDRPLIVLAAGKRPPPPGMTEDSYRDLRREKDQERLETARLSRNSKFILDPGSGHDIQIDNPELVARAVEEVVIAVTRKTKLAH